jgi:hypothetical protein
MSDRPTLRLKNFADLRGILGEIGTNHTPADDKASIPKTKPGARQGIAIDFLGEYRWDTPPDRLGELLKSVDKIGSYPVYG